MGLEPGTFAFYLITYKCLTRPNDLGYPTTGIFPCFIITYKLGALKFKKLLIFDETRYSGVFEIADYESELKIKKLKMADAIW